MASTSTPLLSHTHDIASLQFFWDYYRFLSFDFYRFDDYHSDYHCFGDYHSNYYRFGIIIVFDDYHCDYYCFHDYHSDYHRFDDYPWD